MSPIPRLPLGSVVSALAGAAVVAFAAGSSSIAAVNHGAKPVRWVLLIVLLGAAVAWARERREPLRPAAAAAAAAGFVALAFVSALWSVDPRLSAGRAVSFALLIAVAVAIARASARDPRDLERVLLGLLAGSAAVAAAGLVVLAVDHADAVQAATFDVPARFKGFGENPNTDPLLLALALPIAGWFALAGRGRAFRAAAAVLALVFIGEIVAAGSRGALACGFAGLAVAAVLAPRRAPGRVAGLAVTVALFGAAVAAGRIPKPTGIPPAPSPAVAAAHHGRYVDAEAVSPLSFDAGAQPSGRPLLGSSGRAVAWRGAIDDGSKRPLLGYGFGTEAKAFIDRYTQFQGDLVENSFLGVFLQVGLIGLAVFLVLAAALAAPMVRQAAQPSVAPFLAVLVAGLGLAVVQSYVYSVGNVGTATLWICAFAGAAAAGARPEAA